MNHENQFYAGDFSNWYEAHPSGPEHTSTMMDNGIGQIYFSCENCMVMQGQNELEAGLPAVVKWTPDAQEAQLTEIAELKAALIEAAAVIAAARIPEVVDESPSL